MMTPTGNALVILEWCGGVMALLGAFLLSTRRASMRLAWTVGIVANLALLVTTAYSRMWGIWAMQAGFLAVNVNGLRRWYSASPTDPELPDSTDEERQSMSKKNRRNRYRRNTSRGDRAAKRELPDIKLFRDGYVPPPSRYDWSATPLPDIKLFRDDYVPPPSRYDW